MVEGAGSSYLIVRLPNVVGFGGNPCQLIPSLTAQVLSGRVTVQSGASRDIVDVDDVVGMAIKLLRARAHEVLAEDGCVVNVVSGISTPVEALVYRLAAGLGCRPVVDRRPGGDRQAYSNARLASLIGPLGFDRDYPGRTIDRYAGQVVADLPEAASAT
jgi:NDP-hexose 4-ketoreductase